MEIIRALLAGSGISFNIMIPDDKGDPILYYILHTPGACFYNGKLGVFYTLLENGSNPYGNDRLGENALYILASIPDEEETNLFRVLVSTKGSSSWLNSQNYYGDILLMVAVFSYNQNAVRVLLEAGTDPDFRGELGITALDYAAWQEDSNIIRLLLNFGAQLDEEDIMLE